MRTRPERIVLFSLTLLTLLFSQSVFGSDVELKVKGISCPFCVYGIEKKLKKVEGIEAIQTNYKQSTIHLTRKGNVHLNLETLEKAVQDAGFSVDTIILTIFGTLKEWEGNPALREEKTGQSFLLLESHQEHRDEKLSGQKLEKLKRLSQQKKSIGIQGRVHRHVDMPVAITVDTIF